MTCMPRPNQYRDLDVTQGGNRLYLRYDFTEELHERTRYCITPPDDALVSDYLKNTYLVGLKTVGVLLIGNLTLTVEPEGNDRHGVTAKIGDSKDLTVLSVKTEEEFLEKIKPVIAEKLGMYFPTEEEQRARCKANHRKPINRPSGMRDT